MLTSNGTLLALGTVALLGAAGVVVRRGRGSRALVPANCTTLQGLLAVLRALQVVAHEQHWLVKGQSFYADHLLLQRIYAGGNGSPVIQDEIDSLGERIVEACGEASVDSSVMLRQATELVEAWKGAATSPAEIVLHAEVSLQLALRSTYDALKSTHALTLGLDDFLMGLASAHDTNIYLLKQRLARGA